MSIQKVLKMAENFVTVAEESVLQSPANAEYHAQRSKLSQFYQHFSRQLRAIIGEMGSDLFTLKHRNFDDKMFKMFSKVYQDLITISKEIDEDKPYIAAEKLVHYVLEKPNSSIIDNLHFLAKYHTKQTDVDFMPGETLKHPEIRSLDAIKKLAIYLQIFMTENPLLKPPSISRPPIGLQESMTEIPAFFAGQEDRTKV